MRRFVLTGMPGAGKTVLLRRMETLGYAVVEEAATDDRSGDVEGVQLYDRSPVCTLALSRFLGFALSPVLKAELARIESEQIYDKRVLFVRGLGFIARTEARQISLEDALRFEKVHEEAYRQLGFELVDVEPGTIEDRCTFLRGLCTP